MHKPLTLWLLLCLCLACPAFAQQPPILSDSALYQAMWRYHPAILRAEMLTEQARQQMRLARGAFDPKLEGNIDRKMYDNKEYFDVQDYVLKIPTWTNTDLKVGYQRARGEYLNPEFNVPTEGLLSVGVSVPLGRGLITDARRTGVGEARAEVTMLEADRVKLLYKTLINAGKDYWSWYYATYALQANEQMASLAQERFLGTVQQYEQGEKPAVDTLDALASLQQRQITYQEAALEYAQQLRWLSRHYWSEEGEALLLTPGMVPDSLSIVPIPPDSAFLQAYKALLLNHHPNMVKLQAKGTQLQLQERLAREYLKPELSVEYNYLALPSTPFTSAPTPIWSDRYKVGLQASFPLFLRKERSKLRLTQLKQDNNTLLVQEESLQLLYALDNNWRALRTLHSNLQRQQQYTENYARLVTAEYTKWRNGESTLFLVNSRETKYLEARLKLLKLVTNYQKAFLEWHWEYEQLRVLRRLQ